MLTGWGEVRVVRVVVAETEGRSRAEVVEGGGGGEEGELEADGHWNWLPDMSMSLMRVSIGVLPTSRTKNSCSMTADETVLSDGKRRRSLPKRVGWLGYCVRQYSSRAHWDFSCSCSMVWDSTRPQASEMFRNPYKKQENVKAKI